MLEQIDADFVANQVSLLRDTHAGAIVVLEGGDDEILFSKFLAPQELCRTVIAFGKPIALGAIELLRVRSKTEGVLVILDADFWHVLGDEPADPLIVLTEFHDLELDMLSSEAFDDMLRELASSSAVEAFQRAVGRTVREAVIEECAKVGRVRLLNETDRWFLSFRLMVLSAHLDGETCLIDVSSYVAELVAQVEPLVVDTSAVFGRMRQLPESLNPYQVAQGHDCIELLAALLSGTLGDRAPDECDAASVERYLRLAYNRDHFERGQLYEEITRWEEDSGYIVLR